MSEENAFPKDIGILLEGAIMAHELFVSLISSGFTEDQSLKIVIGVLTGVQRHD